MGQRRFDTCWLIKMPMIQLLAENDKIVVRNIEDGKFQRTAFPVLELKNFEAMRKARACADAATLSIDTAHAAAPTGSAL